VGRAEVAREKQLQTARCGGEKKSDNIKARRSLKRKPSAWSGRKGWAKTPSSAKWDRKKGRTFMHSGDEIYN